MITVLITLGILVGFVMAVIIPWALLRQLENKDEGKKDQEK
jgi:predicted lysophospholipase L1 biosynthesis ABC-type transport system permease subunit